MTARNNFELISRIKIYDILRYILYIYDNDSYQCQRINRRWNIFVTAFWLIRRNQYIEFQILRPYNLRYRILSKYRYFDIEAYQASNS